MNRDLATIRERYDVVSFMNVLSHVSCPIGFYKALVNLLKPTGCLFMCTGNAADLTDPSQNPSKSYSLPDHVGFGGRRHAIELMEAAGLEVILQHLTLSNILQLWGALRMHFDGIF